MPRPARVPPELRHGPFSRAEGLAAGLTSRQLQGRHLERILPGVFVVREHPMTHHDWIRAADLATPADARLWALTRIQALGLDLGPRRPMHLILPRDLHLDLPGIFLHRTIEMPPVDDVGVTAAAAFVGACATERVIDLIKIGDWLLHHDHISLEGLEALVRGQPWRPGAAQAAWVMQWLDGRAASPPESELRAVLVFAGLPRPEVNVPSSDDPHGPTNDLWYHLFKVAVEYEGGQHFIDREQIARDIGRYASMRRSDDAYEQVTELMLKQPRSVVLRVHDLIARRGYDGPPPSFGPLWRSLFRPVDLRLARRLGG